MGESLRSVVSPSASVHQFATVFARYFATFCFFCFEFARFYEKIIIFFQNASITSANTEPTRVAKYILRQNYTTKNQIKRTRRSFIRNSYFRFVSVLPNIMQYVSYISTYICGNGYSLLWDIRFQKRDSVAGGRLRITAM